MSKRVLIFILLFSLTLMAISLYLINSIDPGKKPKPTAEITNIISGDVKIIIPFKLQDAKHQEFTNINLANKFTILYFGFTHCPDLCPYTLQKFKEASRLLSKDELKQVQFIFVSIDPARDNDASLASFVVEHGGANVIGVTGEEAELDKLTSSLKAYYAKVDEANKENYYVDHTSFVYLLNPKAELITQFSQNASSSEIAAQIKAKILESK